MRQLGLRDRRVHTSTRSRFPGFSDGGTACFRPLASRKVASYSSMRFGLVDSSGLCQAFVLPATAPAPNSWRPGRPTRAVSSLHEEARSRSLEAKWPWIFEQPGRCVDLPAEEIFSGFEGLLLLDELNDTDNQDDGTYSKVRLPPCAVPCIRCECRVRLAKPELPSLFAANTQNDQIYARTGMKQIKFENLACQCLSC